MKIKKAKWLVMLMVVALLLTMIPALGSSAEAPYAAQYTLFRDQDTRVGNVTVWDDNDNLYVKINIDTGNWYLSQSHVHVGKEISDFPLTPSGNPRLGHFDYKANYDPLEKVATVTIPLNKLPDGSAQDILIAVQAVVVKMDGCTIVCDDTAWAGECVWKFGPGSTPFPGSNWATYIQYPPPPAP